LRRGGGLSRSCQGCVLQRGEIASFRQRAGIEPDFG
jgi:hypothetical protein